MVKFNSLNTIIDDILLIARNNNISESESLNRTQIEQWIIQYRALLIKQDIDKGRDVNREYVQDINNVHISKVDYSSSSLISTRVFRFVTDIDIPNTVDFHFKSGIVSVTDMHFNEIQLTTKIRSGMQKSRKYTQNEYTCYREGSKLYIDGPGELEYINVSIIAENPRELPSYTTGNEKYPIPANMIPVLKELIFTKELKIFMPTDNSNNSKNDIENVQAQGK